ncbi:MAG: bifunctional [glutamine synthetase] adenylyltransferase/[glutamine synthetase]-adenylyl-L-tyrosine phosphorylase [Parvibaculaceae bacterium]|nr:bifunctional [glutamine synthetase] adenylyltransferase/[glutamine synthetase]-adenylyl-L-tyrosine phosphorylase [Parvibaculaceae bacterium]
MRNTTSLLVDNMGTLPVPFDADKVRHATTDLVAKISQVRPPQLSAALLTAVEDPKMMLLLESVFGNSPYLTRLLLARPEMLLPLSRQPVGEAMEGLLTSMWDHGLAANNEAELMKVLRQAKAEAAFLIALADISEAWGVIQVTETLSHFADTALSVSVEWLLRQAYKAGRIDHKGLPDAFDGEMENQNRRRVLSPLSGLVVLGMGKYGAFELNYSSDIDIVVFYDPDKLPLVDGLYPSDFFVKLTKSLARIMQDRTQDGYVFRTDLRLRPDPGGTAVAVSLPAAAVYYESRGQNWERAAFIKARPVAGDIVVGNEFLKDLAPFIWRKNLDFASIEDVHSMKRQIHAVGGHSKIAVSGHNIKLGRGGIREIEFFVQTQQLIAGGRDEELRGAQTLVMLDMLAGKGWIEDDTARELKHAYKFLRRLEHRLQMIEDAQTHSIPATPEGLAHIACFSGEGSVDSFSASVIAQLSCVQSHYANLFETAPPLAEESGNLVFTGADDDPSTLETLAELGFKQTKSMSTTIRSWHTGRFAATRNPRSRERLTVLMPQLLRCLGRTSDPDAAFARFHDFLVGLPAGVQLFSLIYSNPWLLDLLADICGTAPQLALYLSKNSNVLDAVIAPDFFETLAEPIVLREEVDAQLAGVDDYETALDKMRIWAREQRFKLGTRILMGSADAEEAGPAYAHLASEIIQGLKPIAEREVMKRHGRLAASYSAVLAMGKLGSEEMSAESDLDLIVIYDQEDPDVQSDGEKPVEGAQYFAKTSQRLINALTAPTGEGSLYEVDMRLRPTGNAGPIATRLESFVAYQRTKAWTWEHMALTRARVVCGASDLQLKIEAAIKDILTQQRDGEMLSADVRHMRDRIAREHSSKNPWDLKYVRGGLLDIEFITQYLQLRYAHDNPGILKRHTRSALQEAGRSGVITSVESDDLVSALDLVLNLTQINRICIAGTLKPDEATAGLKGLLARSAQAPSFDVLEAELASSQARVLELFHKLVVPY